MQAHAFFGPVQDDVIRECAMTTLSLYAALIDEAHDRAVDTFRTQPVQYRKGEALKPPSLRHAFRELPQLRLLMHTVRNSIPPPLGGTHVPPAVSAMMASFAASAVPVLLHTDNTLFPVSRG
jgi:hypothetical protein